MYISIAKKITFEMKRTPKVYFENTSVNPRVRRSALLSYTVISKVSWSCRRRHGFLRCAGGMEL
jgi:hypothetical protein